MSELEHSAQKGDTSTDELTTGQTLGKEEGVRDGSVVGDCPGPFRAADDTAPGQSMREAETWKTGSKNWHHKAALDAVAPEPKPGPVMVAICSSERRETEEKPTAYASPIDVQLSPDEAVLDLATVSLRFLLAALYLSLVCLL